MVPYHIVPHQIIHVVCRTLIVRQRRATLFITAMKLSTAALFILCCPARAFVVSPSVSTSRVVSSTSIHAEIRPFTEKADVLAYGWDGTTALGGAVDNSKPARMLDEIRASSETQSDACQVFNANLGEFSKSTSVKQR